MSRDGQGSYFRRPRTGAGARRRWAGRWWLTRCARSTRPGQRCGARYQLAHGLPGALSPARRGWAGIEGCGGIGCPGGLESVHGQMRVVQAGGEETGLDSLLSAPAQRFVATVTVPGTGEAGEGLSLPYHGDGCAAALCCAGWRRGRTTA